VTTIRAYHSLPDDRRDNPGTYTPLYTIMSDETKRAALLQMALDELKAFKKKYDSLRIVAGMEGLFEEIDKVVPPEPVKKSKREKESRV
jgi:histidinol phosphatase-like PHP family hydrolase